MAMRPVLDQRVFHVGRIIRDRFFEPLFFAFPIGQVLFSRAQWPGGAMARVAGNMLDFFVKRGNASPFSEGTF